MRPVYLEFCGINSFSEKAEIDFTKLLGGGLFGIFGDTGSGKSTILDCIHFALYGKIERSSGTDSINYKCDKAYVIYDFEIMQQGKRHAYRVRRERRRKNNVAKAFLYEYDGDGKLQALAEDVREVDRRVEEIVGLNFDDFKKCIALPQGEFAGLVKARPSERLQLVSRLFDLEKYGDRLSATIRSRSEKTANEAALLLAKMQENAGGSEETIEAEREKLRLAQAEAAAADDAAAETEKELESERRRAEEKKKYDETCLKLARAEQKLAFFTEKRAKAEKFPAAAAVAERAALLAKCVREKGLALSEAEKAAAELETAEKDRIVRKRPLEESGIEGKIERLTRDLGMLEAAEADIAACRAAAQKLAECQEIYRKLKDKFPEENFGELLKANDAARSALGADESFTEFLRHHFKDVLLSEAYEDFCGDLVALAEKYPETKVDVAALIEKYTPKGTGEGFDFLSAQREFKRIEERRRALAAERESIENRKKAYEDNEREKAHVTEDGRHYREQLEFAEKKIERVKDLGAPDNLRSDIERLKAAKRGAEEKVRALEERIAELKAKRETQKAWAAAHDSRERETRRELETLLKDNGFSSVAEARLLAAEIGDAKRAKEECDAFFEEYNVWKKRREETSAASFEGFSEEKPAALESRKKELALKKETLLRAIAVGEREIDRLKALKEKYKELEKQLKAKEKERELWEKLKSLTARGKFMEFIASEYLQEICVSASKTLLSLTGGRYYLKYEDEFKAGDNFNGGALRAVKTLSGGETFLVSLSLALALSGAICAKSLRPIEFFFLDEGFGTLDEKLVDVVMDVLEKLRSKHFSIGLISHVEELKHRIDNKILVSGATDRSGSSVRVETY